MEKNIIDLDLNRLITIIIPCKNEGKSILETINSIPEFIDIVVSDSSTDDTLIYIPKHIKIIKGGLPAIARNNGTNGIKTPYILFLDADMDISILNLQTILKQTIDGDYDLVSTKIIVRSWRNFFYQIFWVIQKIISKWTPFAVGGFMLFKTEEFIKLGMFNEEDKFAEDFHLSMKVNPKKFYLFNYPVITSDRRLKNKGVFYMVSVMIRCWLNRNNDDFYTKDYNYWL